MTGGDNQAREAEFWKRLYDTQHRTVHRLEARVAELERLDKQRVAAIHEIDIDRHHLRSRVVELERENEILDNCLKEADRDLADVKRYVVELEQAARAVTEEPCWNLTAKLAVLRALVRDVEQETS